MTLTALSIVSVAAIIAAITDVVEYKVYNYLTFPLAACGMLYHGLMTTGSGIAYSVCGLTLGLMVLILPYAKGGLGAGDVKFLASIGAWIGPSAILPVVLVGCIATGVYSAVVIVRCRGLKGIPANFRFVFRLLALQHKRAAPSTQSVQEVVRQSARRARLVPFSAMLAIGVWSVVCMEWYSGRIVLFCS